MKYYRFSQFLTPFSRLFLWAVTISCLCVSCDKSTEQKLWIAVVPKIDDTSVTEAKDAFLAIRDNYEGVKIRWDVSRKPTAESQTDLIEKLVEGGIDGILISCIDAEGVREAIDAAVNAGVKVGTFDSDCSASLRSFFIGSDAEAAGVLSGVTLKELCKAAGRPTEGIGLFGGVKGDAAMQARLKGFMTEVADTAALLWSGENAGTGEDQVGDFLTENAALPVNGVVFLSSTAVLEDPMGIVRLDSLCRATEVDTVMGASAAAVFFDPSQELLLDFVASMPHCAVIEQDYGGMVAGGIDRLVKAIRGEPFGEVITITDVAVARE